MKKIAIITALTLSVAIFVGCNGKTTDSGPSAEKESKSTSPKTKPAATPKLSAKPVVMIETSMGTIKAELWFSKAPSTVKNFLKYTSEKYYDGLIFHRVIKGFMIQGGGFSPDMKEKKTHPPVMNEARSDTPNSRGTLAMARTSMIHSATSQFFINHKDNLALNHRDNSSRGFGYCVFGKVIEGMDVVDAIASVKTATKGPYGDVPAEPVIIKSVRQVK